MHFEKHFTLEEANALLPWARSVLHKVRRILEAIAADEPLIKTPAAKQRKPGVNGGGNGGGNGHGDGGTPPQAQVIGVDEIWSSLARDEKIRLVNGLLKALIDEGIVVQDASRGLIDFPGLGDGGEEFLYCYELSDGPKILYWHDLESGYAGRKKL